MGRTSGGGTGILSVRVINNLLKSYTDVRTRDGFVYYNTVQSIPPHSNTYFKLVTHVVDISEFGKHTTILYTEKYFFLFVHFTRMKEIMYFVYRRRTFVRLLTLISYKNFLKVYNHDYRFFQFVIQYILYVDLKIKMTFNVTFT